VAPIPGQPRLLRSINEQDVLNAIRGAERLSRRDLTELSNLSKPTIALVLASLTDDGLVRVAGQHQGARGPRALLYEINPEASYVLSLDVGAEYIRGAVADVTGTVRARGTRTVHAAKAASRTSELVALADALAKETGIRRKAITNIVVGCPGVPAAALSGKPTPWHRPGGRLPLVSVSEIVAAFGPMATVENDVNLAALAELRHGHGREADSFAFVSVGTGIGLGLVLRGELHTGVHGAAGEIGFMPVRLPDAEGSGAAPLETQASAEGIVRHARKLGMRGPVTARRVFEAAGKGDERAIAVVDAEVRNVAQTIAVIASVVDPSLVVLGGGVGTAAGFAEAIAVALADLLPVPPELKVSALGSEAIVEGGLVAGLDLAWDQLLDRR
jgi:predicted NBD/HSP70 family sugar kinase